MVEVACFAASTADSCRDNDIDLLPDEFGGDFGVAVAPSLRPAVLDRDGATLDPTEFAQPLHKGGYPGAPGPGRARSKQSDRRQLSWLLRPCGQRPRRCAAEQSNELTPLLSITSSARVTVTAKPRFQVLSRFSGNNKFELGRLDNRKIGGLHL